LFLAPTESLTLPAPVSDYIDNFVFIPPPLYFAPSAIPPTYKWFGLADKELRTILNVPSEFDGAGIRIAMIDSGFFSHPFYQAGGYLLRPTPTLSSPNPGSDSYGHGTAIAFNAFMVAPKVEVLGIKQSNPPQDSLEEAAELSVDIISCSWGYDNEQVIPILQATILDLVRQGSILLFAAGNGHSAWPASQPEVISIGGVYSNSEGNLSASNFASGFRSNIFADRQVPDLCGLCGQLPKGVYFMLPTKPGSRMDRDHAGMALDGTKGNDGWVGASGTSSATPQVAGVIALLIQKARVNGTVLSPAIVKDILTKTCNPITNGTGGNGAPAVGQPNVATGWGLVDAAAALALI
jgi:subtilisin family serine protease